MLDALGSLRIARRNARLVELRLARSTAVTGWLLLGGAVALAWACARWQVPRLAWVVPGLAALAGTTLATIRRRLEFDREDGLLRIEQRLLGFTSRAAIPLFHLRAVVVAARGRLPVGPRFVAYVERRVGEPIHLDEAQRCAALLPMAEAVAEVAELRLVYDATARATMR